MTPGVYQINFRGLTLREAWRFGGSPFRFALALVLKANAHRAGKLWLPAHEAEAPCPEADLSPEARLHLLPVVTAARDLGYTEGRFGRMIRILDPAMKQGFSYLALHRDRQRGLSVGFVVNHAAGVTRNVVVLTGALVGADGTNHEFLKRNGPPVYKQDVQAQIDRAARDDEDDEDGDDEDLGDDDQLYRQALDVLKSTRRASTSMLQRRLRIGYNRAARIMEIMEDKGIVGPENGSSPREILVDLDTL